MPLKKATKTTKATKPTIKYDLCDTAIIDRKEDALQCEGSCSKWIHRYCVGVSLSHFEDLANSPKLFACPDCFQTVHEAVICQLQSEVTALKDVVAALSDKLHLLKTTIAISQPLSESIESTAKKLDRHPKTTQLSYASVMSGVGTKTAQSETMSTQKT